MLRVDSVFPVGWVSAAERAQPTSELWMADGRHFVVTRTAE